MRSFVFRSLIVSVVATLAFSSTAPLTAQPAPAATSVKLGAEAPKVGTGLTFEGKTQYEITIKRTAATGVTEQTVLSTITRHLAVEVLASADGQITKQKLLVKNFAAEQRESNKPALATNRPSNGRLYLVEKSGLDWKISHADGSAASNDEIPAVRSHLRALYRPAFVAWLRTREFKVGEEVEAAPEAARDFAESEQLQCTLNVTLRKVEGGNATFDAKFTAVQKNGNTVLVKFDWTGAFVIAVASASVLESGASGHVDVAPRGNETQSGKVSIVAKVTPLAKAPEMVEAKQPALYDFTVTTLEGKEMKLSEYAGKVLLIVNVASHCGYTKQYAGLQKLFKDYEAKGVVVLGFPCNEFNGQEPGTAAEIREFCSKNYSVTFPLFSKICVKPGAEQAPLYKFLMEQTGKSPGWNFCKYVIGKDGKPVVFFDSNTAPEDQKLRDALDAALAAK